MRANRTPILGWNGVREAFGVCLFIGILTEMKHRNRHLKSTTSSCRCERKWKPVIKQGLSNWYSSQAPGALPKEGWGEDGEEGKNGNVLLDVSNDHKHINHRETEAGAGEMNRAPLWGGEVEGSAWGMKERMEEEEKWGNEGKPRRFKQHCTAGCLLVLYHHSLTDRSQQKTSFDNPDVKPGISKPGLISFLTQPDALLFHCPIVVSAQGAPMQIPWQLKVLRLTLNVIIK